MNLPLEKKEFQQDLHHHPDIHAEATLVPFSDLSTAQKWKIVIAAFLISAFLIGLGVWASGHADFTDPDQLHYYENQPMPY